MKSRNIVTAIDIGTTKIYTIVAEILPGENEFQVIGHAVSISKGLNNGVIVDVEKVTRDLEASIKSVEYMADIEIKNAYLGVAGKHIESLISHSVVVLGENPREILEKDTKQLEEVAKNKVVPIDRKVIHKILYNYRIDNSEVVKNPLGMVGMKLEADAHIVTGVVNSINALMKSVNNISIEVDDILLEPLASAKSVLTETEKKLGTVLVDIGGGTTDVAIFKNEKLIYTSVLPVGGEHFTGDIASILNIEMKVADRIKKEFSQFINDIDMEDIIEVPSYTEGEIKKIKMSLLKEIIDLRIEDIVEHVSKKIEASGYEDLIPNGIVFTGGSSKIAGLKERAEEYLGKPVRLGVPRDHKGLLKEIQKPENATGIGLLLYGVENYKKEKKMELPKEEKIETSQSMKKRSSIIIGRMKKWFDLLF
ncbi:MAG: cell division protein FtsA [Fusobacteriia bacterium 4572_132]|nr:MAG: cell division protein FtsA [Fusobacteriia bacterium 4572_132]